MRLDCASVDRQTQVRTFPSARIAKAINRSRI